MDRADRSPDRCQRIIDLIDACLAEYAAAPVRVSTQHVPAGRRR